MPLVWLALGFVLGVYVSRTWGVPPAAVALLLTAVAGGFLLWRSWGLRSALPWLLVAGALLGLARGGPHLLDPPGDLERHHGSAAQVRGVVLSFPELFGELVASRWRWRRCAPGTEAGRRRRECSWSGSVPFLRWPMEIGFSSKE